MNRISTLTYLIRYFQSDLDLNHPGAPDEHKPRLSLMGNEEVVPSGRVIENILSFARSFDVLETENAGCVEMILN